MQEPIYIYCPNDLDVFETLEFAERYIEPPEVKSGEYTFYDSEGQMLEAIVVRKGRFGLEHCVI